MTMEETFVTNRRVCRWFLGILAGLALLALLPRTASAQQPSGNQDQYEDLYSDGSENQYDDDRFAIGFGAGIVLPEDQQGQEDGEIYYSANFRWRLWGREGDNRDRRGGNGDYNQRHNQQHYRGRYPGGSDTGGIRGFLEPEIAYWSRSETDADIDDLYLGLNLVGVVPTRHADFYLGVGFGLHSLGGDIITRDDAGNAVDRIELGDTLGGNVHVGVELYVTESFGIFGTGRLDILEDKPFDRQTKVWGGLRFHF